MGVKRGLLFWEKNVSYKPREYSGKHIRILAYITRKTNFWVTCIFKSLKSRSDEIKKGEMWGHVPRMSEINAYVLVGKS
jgi:hypothetical protein